ncbi:cyclophilin-like fold protein [Rhodococcus sp. IEGM 1409]|uniref:cyclophilin-like fold protein n=1 Tax=Rhodococcus sp. IEGM 1409 TaxID=3047082 RepID=UPI0024B7D2FE|nr:cyclophilin-like fold protein [Rhodococcus sp. IEGM 1409]MDI9901627.1 cyclophilin-like fold protein [Rhodococcus sp. IEGM 1409]
MKKSLTLIALAATAAVALSACSSPTPDDTTAASPSSSASAAGEDASTDGMQITITAGDEVITATLNDSQVSRDFAATLPVTLPWYRNGSIEYITELPAPMTETGPFYTDVQPGDLVYYNPMDSITIIYEATSSVPTLTKMGEITSDLNIFESLPDDIDMRIEAA